MPIPVEMLVQRMEWAAARGLSELTFTHDDTRVSLLRDGMAAPATAPVAARPRPQAAPQPDTPATPPAEISAPLSGLCHLSPAPGAPRFASPGTDLAEGQTVCLIEAMKVMTAVAAPRTGRVQAVLVEDGAMVEAGAPLVRLS